VDRYQERGVSSSKEEVHQAVADLDKGLFPGAFCKIMPYDRFHGSIDHTDGAGTKAGLAYLAWKHGFPINVWRGVAQDSLVMNFDDMACVGAGAKGGIFRVTQNINRNPFRIPGEVVAELVAGSAEFINTLISHTDVDIAYSGGETADVADLVRTITVDNSVSTIMFKRDVIDASRIEEGDVIVGFSSTGQATWEDAPNSGIGSNGLTNARHDCLHPDYRADNETYSPEMPPNKVYCGEYHLNDPLPGDERFTVASALLSPTRTYLPLIAELVRYIEGDLHALIHCTGGGQCKIGKFGPPEVEYYKNNLMPIPPLFKFLQEARDLPWLEMFSGYNMGHRLEAVLPKNRAKESIILARSSGIEADIIGKVRKRRSKDRVIIKSDQGTFRYP